MRDNLKKVEDTADRCKNKESWSLVNEITGRTRSHVDLFKGIAQQNVLRIGGNIAVGYFIDNHPRSLMRTYPSTHLEYTPSTKH